MEDPSQLFSNSAGGEARRERRFPTKMTLDLGGGVTAVQGAIVELGLPSESGGAVVVDLVWRPVSHSQLLPVFHGLLELAPTGSHTRLHLHGTYRPPLGPVGAFGDGLLGHRLARQSIATFLRTVAQRTDDEVDRRATVHVTPATYPPDMRDLPHAHILSGTLRG